MFKAIAATSCVLICCMGNPSNARTINNAADDVINNNSRTRNVDRSVDNSGNSRGNTNSFNTLNVDRSRTRKVNKDVHNSFDYSEISNETLQHASVPSPVGPAAADSVAVFTVYGQVDQVGPVAGFSISIPLAN